MDGGGVGGVVGRKNAWNYIIYRDDARGWCGDENMRYDSNQNIMFVCTDLKFRVTWVEEVSFIIAETGRE